MLSTTNDYVNKVQVDGRIYGPQDPEVQKSYYFVDTGLIAGNVYLFAAAQAWFHNCDKTGLAQQLGLRAEQRVLFAQSIGYPEKE